MKENAEVYELGRSFEKEGKRLRLSLESGRQIRVSPGDDGELLEIAEPGGEIVLKIRLTEEGPVIAVEGARVSLRATETLDLSAKKIRVRSEEETAVESGGRVAIESEGEMELRSGEDVRVTGKLIHLN